MYTFPGAYLPLGSSTENSSLSSVLTITAPAYATGLLIQALTQNIRITLDGSTPATGTGSTGAGFQIAAGAATVLIPVREGQQIKVIEEAASAVITYLWVRSYE